MTDGGGQFYSNVALQLYDMLGIRKERIDPGQPWQDFAETLFSIQRRLADYAFSNARTWPEIQQAHQTWWQNYNMAPGLAQTRADRAQETKQGGSPGRAARPA